MANLLQKLIMRSDISSYNCWCWCRKCEVSPYISWFWTTLVEFKQNRMVWTTKSFQRFDEQNVDAILEDVSVPETIIMLIQNLKTTIFRRLKNYGSPTSVTSFKKCTKFCGVSCRFLFVCSQTQALRLRSSFVKGWELNSAATSASQPAAGHSLSFIITIVIMTLGWGLFVGLAAESCRRIWLSRLRLIGSTMFGAIFNLVTRVGLP